MIGKKNWTVDDREKKRRKSSWKVKRVRKLKKEGWITVCGLEENKKNINQFPPNSNDNIMKRREGRRREDSCVYAN